jgi:hypothetical protein
VKHEQAGIGTVKEASLVRKVCLYFPRWLFSGNVGDTVMISCLFRAMKAVYPSCVLEVISDEFVNATFYNDPHVDSFRLPTEKERALSSRRYDLLGGPPQRRGVSLPRPGIGKHPLTPGMYAPVLCFYVMPQWKKALFEHLRQPGNLAALISAPHKNILSLNYAVQTSEEIVNFPDLRPRISLTGEEMRRARAAIGPNAIGINLARIRDGQKRSDREQLRYKKSSWKTFVDKVKAYDPSLRVFEIGQQQPEGIGDAFLKNASIRETAALVHAMKLVVLSDGGLHHICTAVDREVLLFQGYEWNPPDLFKMANAIFSESYHAECRKQCHIFSEILRKPSMKRRCARECYDLDPSLLADDCIGFLRRAQGQAHP